MYNVYKGIFILLLLAFSFVTLLSWHSIYHQTKGYGIKFKMASGSLSDSMLQGIEVNRNTDHVIHLCTTICGLRVKDALVMMWSALVFASHPIHFHLIVSKEAKPRIEREVTSWHQRKMQNMDITMYDTVVPWNHTSRDLMFHRAMIRPCTSQRLFLPDIIKKTDQIMYVDTDVIFMTSPIRLWNEFRKFSKYQAAAFVYESETQRGIYQTSLGYPFYKPHGLNAGVFLMKLSAIRTHHWSKGIQAIYQNFKDKLLYSDQDVINLYFEKHRELLYRLPCPFNYRPSHCDPRALCFPSSQPNKHIALIHGSSQAFIMPSLKRKPFYDIFTVFSKAHQRGDVDPESVVRKVRELFKHYSSYSTCPPIIDIMSNL